MIEYSWNCQMHTCLITRRIKFVIHRSKTFSIHSNVEVIKKFNKKKKGEEKFEQVE